MDKYYLDTSIWLDYYEKRGFNGEIALTLMAKLAKEGKVIIYSDVNIIELKNLDYTQEEIGRIFSTYKNRLTLVRINRNQLEEARRLTKYIKVPKRDALHALVARDNEAILVSRDKHFFLLKYITEIKKPEDLLKI